MLLKWLSFSNKIWLKLGISYAVEALRGDWINLQLCTWFQSAVQLMRRTGMVFFGTLVPVWFIHVQGSAGMAYRLVPFHFEHCRQFSTDYGLYTLWSRVKWNVMLKRAVSDRFSPLRDPSLHRFLPLQLHAPLHPIFGPLLRSHALRATFAKNWYVGLQYVLKLLKLMYKLIKSVTPSNTEFRRIPRFLALLPVRLSTLSVRVLIQEIEIFGNILRHLVPFWPSVDIQVKFYGNRPRGTSPSGPGGCKHTRCSRIWRFWTYRTLYLGNGAR